MNANEIRLSYADLLPKLAKHTFVFWLSVFGNFCSIFGLLAAPFVCGIPAAITVIFAVFALTILFYSYYNLSRSRYRYANMAYYVHYANHVIRDYTSDLLSQKEKRPLEEVLEDLVTVIANCFSVITGTHCRCCIKSLELDFSITTTARDIVSAQNRVWVKDNIHRLEDNTDFTRLWFAEGDSARAYVSNNLPREYVLGNYKNSSLNQEPQIYKWGQFVIPISWSLPYKSTLVAPIRYIERFEPPEEQVNENHWKYRGFLCIDSNATNSFRDQLLVELAGGFADNLYAFLLNHEHFSDGD